MRASGGGDWRSEKLHSQSYREFFIHLAPQNKKLTLTKRLNRHFIEGHQDPLPMLPTLKRLTLATAALAFAAHAGL